MKRDILRGSVLGIGGLALVGCTTFKDLEMSVESRTPAGYALGSVSAYASGKTSTMESTGDSLMIKMAKIRPYEDIFALNPSAELDRCDRLRPSEPVSELLRRVTLAYALQNSDTALATCGQYGEGLGVDVVPPHSSHLAENISTTQIPFELYGGFSVDYTGPNSCAIVDEKGDLVMGDGSTFKPKISGVDLWSNRGFERVEVGDSPCIEERLKIQEDFLDLLEASSKKS